MRDFKFLFWACLIMLAQRPESVAEAAIATTLDAVVGQTVTLPCLTSAKAPVDWLFQRSPSEQVDEISREDVVINGFFNRFTLDTDNSSRHNLILHEARSNDSGVYTCIEQSGIGIKHEIRLIVSEAEAVVLGNVGQPVTLQCNTSFTTATDWTFQRSPDEGVVEICRENSMINGAGERFSVIAVNNRSFSLILHEPHSSDNGVYTCIEDAGIGKQHLIELKVTGQLITSGTATVSEGELVALRCSLNNTLAYRWHVEHEAGKHDVIYNGKQVSEKYSARFGVRHERGRSYLQIQSVRESDQGIYVCSPADTADIKLKFGLKLSDVAAIRTIKTTTATTTTTFSSNRTFNHAVQIYYKSTKRDAFLGTIAVAMVILVIVLTALAFRFGRRRRRIRTLSDSESWRRVKDIYSLLPIHPEY